MASKASPNFVTPVGRLVMGNLYRPRTQDGQGRPLVYKSGSKLGQPRSDIFFALAIPKGQEVTSGYGALSWVMTPWGQEIYKAGCAFMAHAPQLPSFAWKVADGDSVVPNTKGKRLADAEGCRGHWILFFTSTIAFKICNADGSQHLTQPDAVKPGYFVQVGFNAKGNDSPDKPGIYLNPVAVALVAYGEEIQTGVDTGSLGFGQNVQLPAGASMTPLGQLAPQNLPGTQPMMGQMAPPMMGQQMMPPPGMQGAVQPQHQQPPQPGVQQLAPPMGMQPQMQQPVQGYGAPPMGMQPQQPMMAAQPGGVMPGAMIAGAPGAGYTAGPMGAGYVNGAMTSPSNGVMQPPPGVQPNAGFLQPQQAVHQMTAAAQGTYEQYRQAGYTDEALRSQGLML